MVTASDISQSQTDLEATPEPKKGETFAFVVEFQKSQTTQGEDVKTNVYQMVQPIDRNKKGNGKSQKWEGPATPELCDWLNDQIGIPPLASEVEEPAPESTPEPVAVEKEPVIKPTAVADKQPVSQPTAVSITQIRAYQPPDNSLPAGKGLPGQMFQGFLKGNQPFALGIDLALTPATPETAASQLYSYQIQAYATNRQTGGVTQLQPAVGKLYGKGEIKKATKLAEVSLPPGFYRLQIMATMEAEPTSFGFLEIPLLQVV